MAALPTLTRTQAKVFMREPLAVFFGLVFPALLLIVIGSVFPGATDPAPDFGGKSLVEIYAPVSIVLGLATVSISLLPAIIGGDRERGILRRLSTTPVHPRALVMAHLLVQLAVVTIATIAAVLLHYGEAAKARLRHIGDRLPADRNGMIDSFFGQLAGWASSTPRWSGSGFTRLVIELGDLPGHPARAIARRAKGTTENWLAGLLQRARVARPRDHAREIMLLMEGAMALTLIHGNRRYIDAAARAAKRLMRRA